MKVFLSVCRENFVFGDDFNGVAYLVRSREGNIPRRGGVLRLFLGIRRLNKGYSKKDTCLTFRPSI